MLQIIINEVEIDLPSDIEIEIELENPFFCTDRIPVSYVQSFEVPATPNNLKISGHSNRISSSTAFGKKQPGEIRHSGLVLARGEFTIEEAGSKVISLKFNGGVLPTNIRKHLQNQNIGKEEFGEIKTVTSSRPRPGTDGITIDIETPRANYVKRMEQLAQADLPDYVAAPLAIKGAAFIESVQEEGIVRPDSNLANFRAMRVNSYRPRDRVSGIAQAPLYDGYRLSSLRGYSVVKIIPAFRVGFILSKLIDTPIVGNVFDGDLSRMMLICNYAPSYQVSDNAMVWSIEDNKAMIRFSDYLPDVPANEFISDILKYPCATLYIQGNTYTLELNEDTLKRPATKDWSDKLEDDYTISIVEGEKYIFALSGDKTDDVPVERERIIVDSIQDMITSLDSQVVNLEDANIFCYEVTQTEQIFEAMPEPLLCTEKEVHWRLKLLSQSPVQAAVKDEESDQRTFEMSPDATVCRTVVVDYLCESLDYRPWFEDGKSKHIRCVMPEVDINTKEPARSSDIVLGLWHGMQYTPKNAAGDSFAYPLISHSNYMPDGSKNGESALTNSKLVEKNHKHYKDWVEKDKKKVIGKIGLSPREINQFDFRDKLHVCGRGFLVRTMTIPLTLYTIGSSSVELVEA